ncbi:MAG: COG4705 family protein, partial [Candidatus Nucleicultricaceae bacterium]
KIAEVTIYFWILKILATTLGETAGDMFSMTFNMGYIGSFLLTGIILFVILFCQIRAERFYYFLFWGAIIATTTVGTEISDMMDRTFQLGYFWGSLALTSGLLATLAIWYSKEKTLHIYPINQRWPEIMFWVAVLFSNSLGTAFGDFLTDNLQLSYLMGALVTSGVIGIVAFLHYMTKVNETVLFWVAFVFTRPFGATFGDFLTKPHEHAGLSLDRIKSSIILMVLFSIVLYISKKRNHAE